MSEMQTPYDEDLNRAESFRLKKRKDGKRLSGSERELLGKLRGQQEGYRKAIEDSDLMVANAQKAFIEGEDRGVGEIGGARQAGGGAGEEGEAAGRGAAGHEPTWWARV